MIFKSITKLTGCQIVLVCGEFHRPKFICKLFVIKLILVFETQILVYCTMLYLK